MAKSVKTLISKSFSFLSSFSPSNNRENNDKEGRQPMKQKNKTSKRNEQKNRTNENNFILHIVVIAVASTFDEAGVCASAMSIKIRQTTATSISSSTSTSTTSLMIRSKYTKRSGRCCHHCRRCSRSLQISYGK